MKAGGKTKDQLIKELADLQKRVKQLESKNLKAGQDVAALKESENRFQNIFESSKDGIIFFEGKTRKILLANKAMSQLLGCSKESLIGRSIPSLHPPEEWPDLEKEFQKHVNGKISVSSVIPVLRDDGSVFRADISSSPITLEGKSYFSAFVRDITERRRTEEALLESGTRYRSLFENSDDAILLTAPDGRIFQANPAACRLFGRTEADIIQVGRNGLIDQSDPSLSAALAERERTGRFRGELIFKRQDGRLFPGEMTSVIFRSKEELRTCMIIRDISEQRQFQEALQESEEKYRHLIERAGDGIGIGQDRKLKYVNPRLAQILDYEVEELIGLPFADFFMPDEIPKVVDRYTRRMAGEEVPSIYESALKRKDGSRIEVELNAGMISYQGRSADMVIVRDITERKRAQETLAKAEEKYRGIVENAVEGIYQTTSEGKFLMANPALANMLGYESSEEMIRTIKKLDFQAYANPLDRERSKKIVEEEGVLRNFELQALRKDGEKIWINLNARLVRDSGGKILYYEGTVEDISERKRAASLVERALQETRIRFEVSQALTGKETEDEVLDTLIQQAGIFPQALVAILTLEKSENDLVGILRRISYFDSGLSRNVSSGTSFPASEFPILNQYLDGMSFISENVLKDQRVDPLVRDLICRAGGKSFAAFPLKERREVLGVLLAVSQLDQYFDLDKQHLFQTLTEQGAVALQAARLRAQVRESQQRFQALVETVSDWIWEVDQNGVYTYVSPRVREALGYAPEDLLGKTPYFLMPREAGFVTGTFGRLLASRQPLSGLEITCRHKDGRLIMFETSCDPFYDTGGNFKGYRGVNRDITERKRAEAALRESEERYRELVDNSLFGIGVSLETKSSLPIRLYCASSVIVSLRNSSRFPYLIISLQPPMAALLP